MKDLTKKFLSEQDKKRIIDTVKDIEKTTSGEIVPMIVSRSHAYNAPRLLGTLLSSLAIALAAAFILKNYTIWLFVPAFAVSLFAVWGLSGVCDPFHRFFIPDEVIESEVSDAAMRAFYESGLYRTRAETGVLLFISIFERRVYVLADRGINERVDRQAWEKAASIITDGIKHGSQVDAICEAVKYAGALLAEQFPPGDDNPDELRNFISGK